MKKVLKDTESISCLLELIKEGDENAFANLFNKLWKPLYVRALHLLGSKDIAEDIVQEVFIDLWKRRYNIENDNLEAYLYKAVTFKVYKELRDTKFSTSHLKILEDIPSTANVNNELHMEDTSRRINQILNDLPSRCRQVFILSRFKGFKNSEISTELNISQRTVEAHISKAIKAMKKNLSYFFFFL